MQAKGQRRNASLLECSRVQEVAGFAVHPSFRGVGRGDSLLDWLEQDARYRRNDLLVLLTTRTADWFQVRILILRDPVPPRPACAADHQDSGLVPGLRIRTRTYPVSALAHVRRACADSAATAMYTFRQLHTRHDH
jgi:GNAT superfamily N-acetyltransferase